MACYCVWVYYMSERYSLDLYVKSFYIYFFLYIFLHINDVGLRSEQYCRHFYAVVTIYFVFTCLPLINEGQGISA